MLSRIQQLLIILIGLSVWMTPIAGSPTKHSVVNINTDGNTVSVQQSGGGKSRAIVVMTFNKKTSRNLE
jgi:hypothetical protein